VIAAAGERLAASGVLVLEHARRQPAPEPASAGGIDWADASIGAGGLLGLSLIGLGGTFGMLRIEKTNPPFWDPKSVAFPIYLFNISAGPTVGLKWDAGSAKMLARLGFEALTTTSAGFAFSVGKPDAEGAVEREETETRERTRRRRCDEPSRFGRFGERVRR
jgi:hypothetical protein